MAKKRTNRSIIHTHRAGLSELESIKLKKIYEFDQGVRASFIRHAIESNPWAEQSGISLIEKILKINEMTIEEISNLDKECWAFLATVNASRQQNEVEWTAKLFTEDFIMTANNTNPTGKTEKVHAEEVPGTGGEQSTTSKDTSGAQDATPKEPKGDQASKQASPTEPKSKPWFSPGQVTAVVGVAAGIAGGIFGFKKLF